MPVRCARCRCSLTGLPARAPCPECGSRLRQRYYPSGWSRFRRWPGIFVPAGVIIALAGFALGVLRVVDWLPAAVLVTEGALVTALGFVNWR